MKIYNKLKDKIVYFLLGTKIPPKYFISKKESPQFHSESFGKKLHSLMKEYDATIRVSLDVYDSKNPPTFWFELGTLTIGQIDEQWSISAEDVETLGKRFSDKEIEEFEKEFFGEILE